MTKQELIQKIVDLEWEDFEVKTAESSVPKSAWESVSAFSNSSGGWLIFGIEQIGKKFNITGVHNSEKIEQDFLVTLRSGEKFNTIITPECKRYKFEDKTVLGFYISPSGQKPIYFNNNQHNTFIRKGSADLRASKSEVDYLYRDQTFGVRTSEILEDTSSSSLKVKSVHEYRDYMSRFNPTVGYNQKELNDFLTSLRIIDKETEHCTVAGLLFFGQREQIEQFFPDFRIDLLEIPGISYNSSSSRYTFRLNEDDYENLWEAYFECFRRLRKTVDIQFQLTSEGFGEELSPGLNAVREVLVNMLMHADYYSTSCPRIRIFTNHIEFYNPGGLPKPLKELKEKDLSIPRNPILAKLFRMVKLAENAGYGFDKIESNWKRYNHTKPEYNIDFDSVIIKMKIDEVINDENVGVDVGINVGVNNVLEIIEKTPGINSKGISFNFDVTQRTVERWIEQLRNEGKIEFKGAPKTGGYFLKE
ncbi:MAG: putative DNA binding domain-containing protein [Bacteroidia bacterium]|nr:putative DNA binding domain-containing protein [Bacteroidia bacterium]